MISRSLNIKKPYRIVDIPDIHSLPHWVSYVEKLLPKFNMVYSGNEEVRGIFEDKGYSVKKPDSVNSVSATQIRQMMVMGANWRPLVTKKTYDAIHSFGGERRLLEIHNRNIRPVMVVDMLIVYKTEEFEKLVLERRGRHPFRGFFALPGGHVEIGFENTKEAAVRETEEETGLMVDPDKVKLFDIYSDPQRDPRGPYISAVYWTIISKGVPKAGDDARSVALYEFNKIPKPLAFDHSRIVDDFLKWLKINL